MSIKKGLGRSFASLIPTELIDESFDPTVKEDHRASKLLDLPIHSITPDESQPRRNFDDNSLLELANSIKEFGVLQPIVVVKHGNDEYMIVAGERRWRASKLAGRKSIPAIVRTMTDQNRLEVSLIENVQRKDLNVIEIATAYVKLRDQFNLSIEQISKRLANKSASAISNTVRLLKLPQNVKRALAAGELTEGQARPLIGLEPEMIDAVLSKMISEGWSTRKIEQYVGSLKADNAAQQKPTKLPAMPYEKESERLRKALGVVVNVSANARGAGQIVIKFKNNEEFERLNSKLVD